MLFDAQGTLFTQRASLAFGEDLGRTSSPERRPCERSKVGHGPPDRRLGETECGEDVPVSNFLTRQKVLPGFYLQPTASFCLWTSTRLLSLFFSYIIVPNDTIVATKCRATTSTYV